jgi:hypothetical protein
MELLNVRKVARLAGLEEIRNLHSGLGTLFGLISGRSGRLSGFNPLTGLTNHGGVASNLGNKIKEVAVSVWAVGRKTLIASVQVRS